MADHPPPTIPLFESPPRVGKRARTPAQRAHTFARCPRCKAHDRVALVLTSSHLVYREHTYRTWSGAPMTCSASGVAVCELPTKDGGVPCVHPATAG